MEAGIDTVSQAVFFPVSLKYSQFPLKKKKRLFNPNII